MNIYRIICNLFSHRWSVWEYESSKSCQLKMYCTRCSKIKLGIVSHEFIEKKYENYDDEFCNEIKVCSRCKKTEIVKQKHEWLGWSYVSDSSCEQENICNKCKTVKYRSMKHIWSDFEYVSDKNCYQKIVCNRCGEVHRSRIQHFWSEWNVAKNLYRWEDSYRICSRCGEKELACSTQSSETFNELVNHESYILRIALARNNNITLDIAKSLIKDSKYVKEAFIENIKYNILLLEGLSKDSDLSSRLFAASHRSTPKHCLYELARDERDVKIALVNNKSAEIELLFYLCKDDDLYIRDSAFDRVKSVKHLLNSELRKEFDSLCFDLKGEINVACIDQPSSAIEYSSLLFQFVEEESDLFFESELCTQSEIDPCLFSQSEQSENIEIKNYIKERKIKYLVHFTRIDNLQSILSHGLLPRNSLIEQKIDFIYTDSERFDGHLDGISISVSFPNYKMFYKKRQEVQNSRWVVIFLSIDIIFNLNCLFVSGNAAESNNTKYKTVNNFEDLKNMFNDECVDVCGDKIFRKNLNIPDNYTTNPQSEILVFNHIDIKYVKKICFQNLIDLKYWTNIVNMHKLKIDVFDFPFYFKPRMDYPFWNPKKI